MFQMKSGDILAWFGQLVNLGAVRLKLAALFPTGSTRHLKQGLYMPPQFFQVSSAQPSDLLPQAPFVNGP